MSLISKQNNNNVTFTCASAIIYKGYIKEYGTVNKTYQMTSRELFVRVFQVSKD